MYLNKKSVINLINSGYSVQFIAKYRKEKVLNNYSDDCDYETIMVEIRMILKEIQEEKKKEELKADDVKFLKGLFT